FMSVSSWDYMFYFVLAFESVAGRAKGSVLIFCFVLHQGKMKNKPKGCVRNKINKFSPITLMILFNQQIHQ
uniref:hypothetical protein n=1 Tax=uncultured Dysgonomonas sp. TaxID=206096 RepID=UPI00261B0F2D